MKMTKQEAGRLGGLATVAAHGSVHMEAIGREGLWVRLERHHGGDIAHMMDSMRRKALAGKSRKWCPMNQCWVKA